MSKKQKYYYRAPVKPVNEEARELMELRKAKKAHLQRLRHCISSSDAVERNIEALIESAEKMMARAERDFNEWFTAEEQIPEVEYDIEVLNERIKELQCRDKIAKLVSLQGRINRLKAAEDEETNSLGTKENEELIDQYETHESNNRLEHED